MTTGIFVKAGQYIGTMNHVMPSHILRFFLNSKIVLLVNTWDAVKAVLEEIRKYSSIFDFFSESPVAAASLYKCTSKTNARHGNRKVAVKIQYPGLAKQVDGDLWTMKIISSIVGRVFPDYQYAWLLPEFEKVAEEELNFLNEARNGQRTMMLSKHKDVYVPMYILIFQQKEF